MLEAAILASARQGVCVKDEQGPEHSAFHVACEEDGDELDVPVNSSAPQALSPGLTVAVPELTHPGESQSNGLAERAVQSIEGSISTHLAALQAHIKIPIPANHPLLAWIIHHSSYLLNKYQLGADGHTAWGRLHGTETREHVCEFGETYCGLCPSASEANSIRNGATDAS